MKIYFDEVTPADDVDVIAVDRVIDRGLVQDGQHVTRAKLAELLDCTHHEGQRPCRVCASGRN